ncbi:LysM peptidoglycan-binding domain-containing protein [Alkalibacillus salilacus]|uniref:Stage VI sporulation protein D n=1 Tax=Alkalibacillus salilacus TaxID=284582 RepID=A0ABT9VCS4_9BACI|nr:LysM domain-containing protein [Alkalibacillus salilacus]MDQ0158767.1 stage VI sporulation protein D [Alkalibacillus salilacus]
MSSLEGVPYQFDVQEHIMFRQGEEIEDLYSIAIDPDVNVIHQQSTMQIRGVLIVHGDYLAREVEQEDTIVVDEDQQSVQQVRALDNGFMEFQYPIPVDISIPYERVNSDEGVNVIVDYFDYEIPEPKTLKVYTTIRLEGTQVIDTSRQESEILDEQETTDFELKQFPVIEEDEDETHDETEPVSEKQNDEKESGRDLWHKKQTTSLKDFVNQPKNKTEAPKEYDKKAEPKDESKSSKEDVDSDYDEDKSDNDDHQSPVKKGLDYLSKFFREDDERQQVKMTVRFVQADETLSSIAASYDMSVHQLERLNNIESSFELKEGDVLLVPTRSGSSSY